MTKHVIKKKSCRPGVNWALMTVGLRVFLWFFGRDVYSSWFLGEFIFNGDEMIRIFAICFSPWWVGIALILFIGLNHRWTDHLWKIYKNWVIELYIRVERGFWGIFEFQFWFRRKFETPSLVISHKFSFVEFGVDLVNFLSLNLAISIKN